MTISLVGGGILLVSAFRASVERSFDTYLAILADGLISTSRVDKEGAITITRSPPDPRFRQPFSGWYWQVTQERALRARSASLWDDAVEVEARPGQTRHTYTLKGPSGKGLRVLTRVIKFPENPTPYVFLVAGDQSEVQEEVEAFTTSVVVSLGILGVILVVGLFLLVWFGLLPLKRIPPALSAIRSGRTDRLTGSFPAEVDPLVHEINALLEHNQEVVERARTHVGNLAHALKTPIAVLTNDAAAENSPFGRKVAEQIGIMQEQVDHHLGRARTAARASVLTARTSVMPVVEGLARTLAAIYRAPQVAIDVRGDADAVFRGERQDLEEVLGNLMDNAAKYSAGRVKVKVKLKDASDVEPGDDGEAQLWLLITIEDNGSGLSPAEQRTVLKRGERLDESAPGHGLGLSIVSDTVAIYGGKIAMDSSDLGGLKVVLTLPAAASEGASRRRKKPGRQA